MIKTLKTWTFATTLCCLATTSSFGQVPSYSTQAITKDLKFFSDWTASQLADGFKNKQLKQFSSPEMRHLAEQMKNGTYESHYLLNTYAPIPSNKILEELL